MPNSEFSAEVLDLIRTSVPTMDALELLIFVCRHRDRSWTVRELVAEMSPTVVADASARDTLATLESHGLVVREGENGFRFDPATDALARGSDGLLQAYDKRPVTLIRTLYAIADSKKIQAFADAFRIRKDS